MDELDRFACDFFQAPSKPGQAETGPGDQPLPLSPRIAEPTAAAALPIGTPGAAIVAQECPPTFDVADSAGEDMTVICP